MWSLIKGHHISNLDSSLEMWADFNRIVHRFLLKHAHIRQRAPPSAPSTHPHSTPHITGVWRDKKTPLKLDFNPPRLRSDFHPYHIGKTCRPKPFRNQKFDCNHRNMVTFDPAGAGLLIPTDRFLNRPGLWLTALRPNVSPRGSVRATSYLQWLTITGCNKGTQCCSCRHTDM